MGGAQSRVGLTRSVRQRSEQYFTSSQTFSHFLRQVKGRPQTTHVFCGKSPFFCIFAKTASPEPQQGGLRISTMIYAFPFTSGLAR